MIRKCENNISQINKWTCDSLQLARNYKCFGWMGNAENLINLNTHSCWGVLPSKQDAENMHLFRWMQTLCLQHACTLHIMDNYFASLSQVLEKPAEQLLQILYTYVYIYNYIYGQCRNYRTEVEEDEGTVIYRTLLFYNSVFLGRYEKNVSDLPPNFFRRSIILVGALLFYNSVFPHFSHISHFCSIINFPRAPFYN